MALSGSLLDFTVIDVFQLIRMQRKDGILTLMSREETVTVRFGEGDVLFAENSHRSMAASVEQWMVRAGVASQELWDRAKAQQTENGRPIGTILNELGRVDPETLSTYARHYRRKTVFNLFRWLEGDYTFEVDTHAVPTLDASLPPMNTDDLLMEAACRAEEWPILEETIGSMGNIYSRVGDVLPDASTETVVKDEAPKEEAAEDDFGFMEEDEATESSPEEDEHIWSLLDGKRDVNKVLDDSMYAAFESCRSLASIINRSGAEVVGEAAPAVAENTGFSASFEPEPPKVPSWPAALVGIGSALAVLLCVGLLFGDRTTAPGGGSHALLYDSTVSYRDHKVRQALSQFQLIHGTYPESLVELQALGLLSDPKTVSGIQYNRVGKSYTLHGEAEL